MERMKGWGNRRAFGYAFPPVNFAMAFSEIQYGLTLGFTEIASYILSLTTRSHGIPANS
jgi:hypothetical protein